MTNSTDPLLSEQNPYAPPLSRFESAYFPPGSPEHIRTEHLTTEGDIQTIGTSMMLLALVVILSGLVSLPRASSPAQVASTISWIVFGFLLGNFGKAVHRLRPWVRWPMVVLALPTMLLFPLGTLFSGLVLIRMLREKGKTVLGPEYAGIMQQTPHIRYHYSMVTKVLVFYVLVLAILGAFLFYS